MNIPVLNFQDFISSIGDDLITDSRKVSVVHGKRHDNVLRLARQRMIEAGAWGLLNFKETQYIDNQNGQIYPVIEMTKDGYMFLVGKMTGKKAVEHQIAYIKAFNDMAAYIKNQREGLQYQYLRKELEYKGRKSQISNAARQMRNWQDEKPARLSEMDELMSKLQPGLNFH